MHDFDVVFQYRGKSGKVYSWSNAGKGPGGSGGFYHDIFDVDDAKGRFYLCVATFIASGSLNSQSIEAVRINGERIDLVEKLIRTPSGLQNSISFEYDFGSVLDRKERPIKLFHYDEQTKSFRFPVVVQDDENPQGRVTDKFIRYRFNGKHFVKVS